MFRPAFLFCPILLGASLLGGCRIDPGMAATAVLQRPRMVVTTETVPHGTMQSETGLNLDPGHTLAVPGIWRFGLSQSTEAYVGGNTYQWDFDRDVSGPGDLLLGFRHRFWGEDDWMPAMAFQSETKLPTADEDDGFGTEVIDYRFALIADKHSGDTLFSIFAQAGILGEATGPRTDFEFTIAGSVQQPFDDRWSWYLEGISTDINERNLNQGYVGGGLHYRLKSGAVLDIALARGFGDAPEDTLVMLGYTRSIGSFYRLK